MAFNVKDLVKQPKGKQLLDNAIGAFQKATASLDLAHNQIQLEIEEAEQAMAELVVTVNDAIVDKDRILRIKQRINELLS